MAGVARGQLFDKAGLPDRFEAIDVASFGEATESRVDENQLRIGCRLALPCHLMDMNVTRAMASSGQKAGVVSRFVARVVFGFIELSANRWQVVILPNVDAASDRQPTAGKSQPHRFF